MTLLDTSKKYQIGALQYTPAGIIVLFFWLLTGSFSFSMLERLIPILLPLSLRQMNCSNQTIGLLVGSLPSLLNIFINPIISSKSDRTRSRWGRRIPYLVLATPFACLGMLLLGWSPQLGGWVQHITNGALSAESAGLTLMIVFCVLFQIFYMVVGSIFYYLFADVIPEYFMGRFFALFSLTGTAATYLFQRFCLAYAEHSIHYLYTMLAILYGVGFLLTCIKVREGSYPAVPEKEEKESLGEKVVLYFRDCFSHPYYLSFFLGTALNAVSGICGVLFGVFFAQENLGLTLEQYGKVAANVSLVSLICSFPFGFLADKMHPLRLYIVSVFIIILVNAYGFWWVNDMTSYYILSMGLGVIYTMQATCTLPMFAALLPREKYGQFCSAQAIFAAMLLAVANWGGGFFMDWSKDYRNIYLWDFAFTLLALPIMGFVYIRWKKYGGRSGYKAPL